MLVTSAIRSRMLLAGSTSSGSIPSRPDAIRRPKSMVVWTLKMPLTLPAKLRVPTMRGALLPGGGSTSTGLISNESMVANVSTTEALI